MDRFARTCHRNTARALHASGTRRLKRARIALWVWVGVVRPPSFCVLPSYVPPAPTPPLTLLTPLRTHAYLCYHGRAPTTPITATNRLTALRRAAASWPYKRGQGTVRWTLPTNTRSLVLNFYRRHDVMDGLVAPARYAGSLTSHISFPSLLPLPPSIDFLHNLLPLSQGRKDTGSAWLPLLPPLCLTPTLCLSTHLRLTKRALLGNLALTSPSPSPSSGQFTLYTPSSFPLCLPHACTHPFPHATTHTHTHYLGGLVDLCLRKPRSADTGTVEEQPQAVRSFWFIYHFLIIW